VVTDREEWKSEGERSGHSVIVDGTNIRCVREMLAGSSSSLRSPLNTMKAIHNY
jgi:hypothetical protein